jgi:hypothetical protein
LITLIKKSFFLKKVGIIIKKNSSTIPFFRWGRRRRTCKSNERGS